MQKAGFAGKVLGARGQWARCWLHGTQGNGSMRDLYMEGEGSCGPL